MSSYILKPYSKGGKTLYPRSDFRTAECLHDKEEFCLDEFHIQDDCRKVYARYRLHTKEPYRFYDTMDFDIRCPRCGDVLRLCGNPIDLHDHGVYRCRRCDEGR